MCQKVCLSAVAVQPIVEMIFFVFPILVCDHPDVIAMSLGFAVIMAAHSL